MTDVMQAPYSRRWLYAPLVFVILLALAWTGGWFYAAQRAEAMMAAWIEREARDGRSYTCGERSLGGYPFRIELRCSEPSVELRQAGVSLKAQRLTAVAQVYQPDLVIAEVTGPMQVTSTAEEGNFIASWTLLQASLRGRPHAPERISLVVDGVRLERPDRQPVGRADRLEVHVRRSSGTEPTPAFDLALRTSGASVAGIAALAERPFAAEATGILRGINDLRPKPVAARLREWQAAGGRFELTRARIAQAEAVAVATGVIGLTPQGKLDGTVHIAMAGLDHAAGLILGQTQSSRASAGLLAGLTMLGRTELEGKRAVAVPLRFRDGRIFFGPIPVGQTPALY
jgi:hypothetical protein